MKIIMKGIAKYKTIYKQQQYILAINIEKQSLLNNTDLMDVYL